VPEEWRRSLSVWRQDRARRARVDLGALNRTQPIALDFGRSRGGTIDRYYIERFLERHATDITGRVLEVGDSAYTTRFGQDVTHVEVLDINPANPRATIISDVTHLEGVESETYDCIVLTQVLGCVYDVRSAMHALARVTRPGGVLLATVCGITRSALDAPEYFRFTALSTTRLAEEAFGEQVEVATYGNVLVCAAWLYGLGMNDVERAAVDVHDPRYELIVSIRAIKTRHPR